MPSHDQAECIGCHPPRVRYGRCACVCAGGGGQMGVPERRSEGGGRADSTPWHPSGLTAPHKATYSTSPHSRPSSNAGRPTAVMSAQAWQAKSLLQPGCSLGGLQFWSGLTNLLAAAVALCAAAWAAGPGPAASEIAAVGEPGAGWWCCGARLDRPWAGAGCAMSWVQAAAAAAGLHVAEG